MMGRIFSLIGLVFLSVCAAQAQNEDEKSKEDFLDHFFLNYHLSFFVDEVSSPVRKAGFITNDPNPNYDPNAPIGPNNPVTVENKHTVPYQDNYFNILSLGVEPRYNLWEHKKHLAVGVSIPLSLGYGQILNGNNHPDYSRVKSSSGSFNIQVPILAKVFVGAYSTKKYTASAGANFGAGLEINKVGLLQTGNISGENLNKAWVLPVFYLGFVFDRYGNPMEFGIKYGQLPVADVNPLNGFDLMGNGAELTSANSFSVRPYSLRVSFSYYIDL